MKKKIAAAICMILIGTSLAACGGSSANENNTEEKGEAGIQRRCFDS